MRRKGTVDELAQRRAKGLALLEQGKKMSEIAELLDTTLGRLAVGSTTRASLAPEDESGFSLVSSLKRTWAPRGETSTVRASISHHDRLNLIGALVFLPKGQEIKLSLRSYWHSLTGKEVIIFLKQLLRCCPGFIVLVWDNHPIHKRKSVQEFLAAQPRLIVYHFPTAAPELNPAEYIWAQISEHTAGTAPRNHKELRAIVMAGVARTRRSQRRFLSCPLATHLNWL